MFWDGKRVKTVSRTGIVPGTGIVSRTGVVSGTGIVSRTGIVSGTRTENKGGFGFGFGFGRLGLCLRRFRSPGIVSGTRTENKGGFGFGRMGILSTKKFEFLEGLSSNIIL